MNWTKNKRGQSESKSVQLTRSMTNNAKGLYIPMPGYLHGDSLPSRMANMIQKKTKKIPTTAEKLKQKAYQLFREDFHSNDHLPVILRGNPRVNLTETHGNGFKGEGCTDLKQQMEIGNTVSKVTAFDILSQKKVKSQDNEVKKYTLTPEELEIYGDRFLSGYKKLSLLGKGGFALVWLAIETSTNIKVAVKQLPRSKVDSVDTLKEIKFGKILFENDEVEGSPGLRNIIQLRKYQTTSKDIWVIYELGGAPISQDLFTIKGEFVKGERIYNILHGKLYSQIRRNPQILKTIIREVAKSLVLFSELKIVHYDLKPDNILLKWTEGQNERLEEIKIIDFGSARLHGDPGALGMVTPEYMPPEVLMALLHQYGHAGNISQGEWIASVSNPSAIDVWSLGVIILECLTGIPVWLSLKCRTMTDNGRYLMTMGMFAVKGRAYDKILLKQKILAEGIPDLLYEHSIDCWMADFENLLDLLQQMFHVNPKKRISPVGILAHPFLVESHGLS